MSYAKVLGATSRKDGYLEGNGYLVSWCVGHLVELAPPNVYDEKYTKWSIADLPILPQKWQYLVSASTKKQFGIDTSAHGQSWDNEVINKRQFEDGLRQNEPSQRVDTPMPTGAVTRSLWYIAVRSGDVHRVQHYLRTERDT